MKTFLLNETGLGLSEYAIAAALITISVAGAFSTLGDSVVGKLNELVGCVNS